MNRIKYWAAAGALMCTTLGLQAAGPLAPLQGALQARVVGAALPALALSGEARPALLASLPRFGVDAPLELGVPSEPGLPYLPGLYVDTYWLDYNLTIWPGQVTAWGNNAVEVSGDEVINIAAAASSGDIIGAGNRAAGLAIKIGPAPAPQLPYGVPGLADTLWLDYNLRVWQGQALSWASRGAQTTITELDAIVTAASTGDLAGAGNRAAGLAIKIGPAPAPQFPHQLAPYASPTFELVNETVFGGQTD